MLTALAYESARRAGASWTCRPRTRSRWRLSRESDSPLRRTGSQRRASPILCGALLTSPPKLHRRHPAARRDELSPRRRAAADPAHGAERAARRLRRGGRARRRGDGRRGARAVRRAMRARRRSRSSADGARGRLATERVALIPSDCLVDAATLERVHSADCNGRPSPARRRQRRRGIVLGPRACLAASTVRAGAQPPSLPRRETASLDGALCIRDPRRRAPRQAAERALLRQLAPSPPTRDGPIARLDRALSTRLSRYLVRTPLRPNHITTIGTLIGLLGGLVRWRRAPTLCGVLGTLLFWLRGDHRRLRRRGGAAQVPGVASSAISSTSPPTTSCTSRSSSAWASASIAPRPNGDLPWLVALLVGGFACATAATMLTLVRSPPARRAAAALAARQAAPAAAARLRSVDEPRLRLRAARAGAGRPPRLVPLGRRLRHLRLCRRRWSSCTAGAMRSRCG